MLLSKLRRAVGPELLRGRSEIELVLPPDAFVDVEAAFEALHRAESHIANGEWAEAWGPSGVAYYVASRPLLQGQDRAWLDEWRRRLDEVRLRGTRVLRSGEARPRRADAAAGGGMRAPAHRAGAVPRDAATGS